MSKEVAAIKKAIGAELAVLKKLGRQLGVKTNPARKRPAAKRVRVVAHKAHALRTKKRPAAKPRQAAPGAAQMRRKYGARALDIAARLRNLARTPAQRAHWSKVIRALESVSKKIPRKTTRPALKKNPHAYRYLVSQSGTHLARFLTKTHAMQYARALANKTGRQVAIST